MFNEKYDEIMFLFCLAFLSEDLEGQVGVFWYSVMSGDHSEVVAWIDPHARAY